MEYWYSIVNPSIAIYRRIDIFWNPNNSWEALVTQSVSWLIRLKTRLVKWYPEVEPRVESSTLIPESVEQVIRRKILVFFPWFYGCSGQRQHQGAAWTEVQTPALAPRSVYVPSLTNSRRLAMFTRLSKVRNHGMFQSRRREPGRRNFQGETWTNSGKSQTPREGSVFMFLWAGTVGRNLFCLDQSDTVSSSGCS